MTERRSQGEGLRANAHLSDQGRTMKHGGASPPNSSRHSVTRDTIANFASRRICTEPGEVLLRYGSTLGVIAAANRRGRHAIIPAAAPGPMIHPGGACVNQDWGSPRL